MATTRSRTTSASGEKKTPARKTTRKTTPKKKTTSRTAARDQAAAAALEARLVELLAGVSSRLDRIEARLPTLPLQRSLPGVDDGPPEELQAVTRRLSEALDEVPRAADFEPLAEHIYELARHAPRLLEALEAVPAAMAPFEQSVASLKETAETLQHFHQSFAESLLQLPRPEDYEPLARPLAEFARVSPALVESLANVLRITAPLGESIAGLRRVTEELGAVRDALGRPRAPDAEPTSASASLEMLETTAAELQNARAAVEGALESLPRDSEYKKVAGQLREIASVSPSLLDWLQQVTPLSQPLGESVSALRETAGLLSAGHSRLLALIEQLRR